MIEYRKKPIVIEAVQFVDSDPEKLNEAFSEYPQWLCKAITEGKICPKVFLTTPLTLYFDIIMLGGRIRLNKGDYLILGIAGEVYPCKDEIFKMTYEKVEK